MCGITGKISLGQQMIDEHFVKQMNASIAHRGPDDSGVYISKNKKVGLGHQRLAILDLSPLGHQPMRYLDRYEIVYNGEVYNYQHERELLKKEGYTFASNSDTEVILALYDKYKEKCLQYLRGMFSFAIYDEKENILFCARDRVGKKPFKYFFDENHFIFASELKAILTQPEYKREPDYVAIHHYLTFQYVPAPMTGFKDIKKLEPAHYMILNVKTGQLTKEKYWTLDLSKKERRTKEDWQELILKELDESVKLRMISDVPVGAFLSGGVDSSAIVALMTRHSKKPIKTFSIGFKEKEYNELPFARKVAKHYRTDHNEFIVSPESVGILPVLIKHYEEPFADPSALPTYYVSKNARKHVTVALNGDGGDENFAGYTRYSAFKLSNILHHLSLLNKTIGQPALTLLQKKFPTKQVNRLLKFSKNISYDYQTRYMVFISFFLHEEKIRMYTPQWKSRLNTIYSQDIINRVFCTSGSLDKNEQATHADFLTYLPNDLMVKVDMASMLVALEGRSPFLDHTFLELTARVPFNLKLRGINNKKFILKKCVHDILPDDVINRPKKGFGVPLRKWFQDDLSDFARETLLSKTLKNRHFLNVDSIKQLLHEHKNTKIDYSLKIWALLTLELWFREYFD